MRRFQFLATVVVAIVVGSLGGVAHASDAVEVSQFEFDGKAMCEINERWTEKLLETHEHGTWAEMKLELTDRDLASLGLPSSDVLRAQRYPQPTLVTKDGRTFDVPLAELEREMQASINLAGGPSLVTWAGTGCFGIRPGSFYLIIDGGSISLCSLAHLYGSAISTAGHCGQTGSTATVIAALGNRPDATGVVLLDFGTFGSSHDNGLGDDYATIGINSDLMGLVTPTMCFWGGPRGVYAKTGDVAAIDARNGSVSVNPDPLLAQTIVHYGHGAGVGAGGTPRVAEAIAWRPDHFMFSGAIAPGDSGSGANTLLGDTVGANMQAAGIITHIWVDPLMRDGIGIMGGTRATKLGTPTSGQIVPYPIPISGLP